MTFLGDEGRDVLVVKRMIVDHVFTLLGPTASVGGFFLGPIYYYFMLPFLWLWNLDPSGPAVMVAIFGIATTYLLYIVGRDLFDQLVGYIASSLYAVSPLVIAHSRSSWNPNIVPFFSLLLIYLLWKISVSKKISTMFLIGFVLGLGLQLHYLFLFLFCVTAVWLFLKRTLLKIKHLGMLFLGFFIAYSPFIFFELRHEFSNLNAFIRFLQEGKDTGFTFITFFTNIADVIFRSFARLAFRYPTPTILETLPKWQQYVWSTGILVAIFICFIYAILRLLHMHKYSKIPNHSIVGYKRGLLLLFIWYVIPVLLFGLYRRSIYDYYFGIFFPVPFLFLAIIIAKLFSSQTGAIAGSIIWFSLLVINWQGRPFVYPPNNQLGQVKEISAKALEMTEGEPFNYALITGSNSDHAYRYFFEIWGHKPVTIENFAVDPDRRTVTNQLIVICELSNCKPLGNSLWEIAGFGRADVINEDFAESVPFIKIFKLGHYKGI